MTHTQQIIHDAIEGGWKDDHTNAFSQYSESWIRTYMDYGNHFKALLDPLFWQAVARVRGWDDDADMMFIGPAYKDHMLLFASHVMDGLDYETAIGKLL